MAEPHCVVTAFVDAVRTLAVWVMIVMLSLSRSSGRQGHKQRHC